MQWKLQKCMNRNETIMKYEHVMDYDTMAFKEMK